MVTDAEETEEVPAPSEPPPPAAAPTEQSIPGAYAVAPTGASLDSINTITEAPEPMVAHAPFAPTSHVFLVAGACKQVCYYPPRNRVADFSTILIHHGT